MAASLIKSEIGSGAATLTSASTGNFDYVVGTLKIAPAEIGGAGAGRSFDTDTKFDIEAGWNLNSGAGTAAGTCGAVVAWVQPTGISRSAGKRASLMSLFASQTGSADFPTYPFRVELGAAVSNQVDLLYSGKNQNVDFSAVRGQKIKICIAWELSGGTLTGHYYYRLPGGSWTKYSISHVATTVTSLTKINAVQTVGTPSEAGGGWDGYVSGCQLYSGTSIADFATEPTAVAAPVETLSYYTVENAAVEKYSQVSATAAAWRTFNSTGNGVRGTFTGTRLGIFSDFTIMDAGAITLDPVRLVAIIDGNTAGGIEVSTAGLKYWPIISGLTEGPHTYEILVSGMNSFVISGGSAPSWTGSYSSDQRWNTPFHNGWRPTILCVGGTARTLTAPTPRSSVVLFLGDSITGGAGLNNIPGGQGAFNLATGNDALTNFVRPLARQFSADNDPQVLQVGFHGQRWNGPLSNLPQVSNSLGFVMNGVVRTMTPITHYLLSFGTNDVNTAQTAVNVQAAITSALNALVAADSAVGVTKPVGLVVPPKRSGVLSGGTTIAAAITEAVTAWKASNPTRTKTYVIDAGADWGQRTGDLTWDGLHPNARGHQDGLRYLSARLDATLNPPVTTSVTTSRGVFLTPPR